MNQECISKTIQRIFINISASNETPMYCLRIENVSMSPTLAAILILTKIAAGALEPKEIFHWFGRHFQIKQTLDFSKFPPGTAIYLMKRKS